MICESILAPQESAGRCELATGLRQLEVQAKRRLQLTPEGPRAVSYGQLALEVERLRRKHELSCPDCDQPSRLGAPKALLVWLGSRCFDVGWPTGASVVTRVFRISSALRSA
jgi:hypothetical protein